MGYCDQELVKRLDLTFECLYDDQAFKCWYFMSFAKS